jgi:hypothetical protein
MSEPDKTLVGVEDIAAFAETWWRARGHRRRVSARTVRRWIHHQADPLPAARIDVGGAWSAIASRVSVWLDRHFADSTAMSSIAPNAPNAQLLDPRGDGTS